jgi:hypothetical protein
MKNNLPVSKAVILKITDLEDELTLFSDCCNCGNVEMAPLT